MPRENSGEYMIPLLSKKTQKKGQHKVGPGAEGVKEWLVQLYYIQPRGAGGFHKWFVFGPKTLFLEVKR